MKVLFRVLVLFFGIAGVGTSASFAQSGWFWQNPLPQGNTLRAVARLAPTTVVAAGDLALRLGDTDVLVRAALTDYQRGYPGAATDSDRVRLLEAALERLGPADSAARARVLAKLSPEVVFRDPARSGALREEAVAIARRLGDPETLVEPVHIRYPGAMGREIPALLYIPYAEALRGDGPPPAIVHVHGGPTSQHYRWWDRASQWFAMNGYVVLAPNVRGSTGYGREFQEANRRDWGGQDLEDVVQGLDWLAKQRIADPKRVGIVGWSHGGMITQ